ncbi:predicted protein [Uncinocarpus reesii 1704]|uniref:Uncharacterized protein n=1 Tax=Uncinocarpus reesii (strain UAMH 1704) TaxID=336963 RepID=C4JV75_UNCRE|nr:uncharacterized protein UREG_06467 [Uncinocarpus reesii 1704]EEP81602.1 predicted protein [Uncinocarpus reesii 1704]
MDALFFDEFKINVGEAAELDPNSTVENQEQENNNEESNETWKQKRKQQVQHPDVKQYEKKNQPKKVILKQFTHVQNVKKLDCKNNPNIDMHCCGDANKLFTYFVKNFNPDKFVEIFYWAEPVLDLNQSKALEQWYIKCKLAARNQLGIVKSTD